MDAIVRELGRRHRLVVLAFLAALSTAADAAAESSRSLPAPGAPGPSILFFVERRLGGGLEPSLVEAARRLSESRCQELLTDFSDGDGRTLDENLRRIGQTMPGYLGLVLFYDGSETETCVNERVLAWTSPGSRAVHVCWSQFSYWQRQKPGYAANIVIHEALHTLGLRERPPLPSEITDRVIQRCGP